MDFTREPIIETVITPKEGCKLVVRSSKSTAQEEYFVDAIEVVSFGHSFFFRSLERPKAFLVPVSDYEVLEVREARMVLKNVGIDRTIKIGGGRDAQMRGSAPKDLVSSEKNESSQVEEYAQTSEQPQGVQGEAKSNIDPRLDKKRDRRRQYRRRRGREDGALEGAGLEEIAGNDNKEMLSPIELTEPRKLTSGEDETLTPSITTTSILTSLLPPPSTLISETIARYKDNALFRGAFYSKEESKPTCEEERPAVIPLAQPEYGSFEMSEEEEERIYQQRKQHSDRGEGSLDQSSDSNDENQKEEDAELASDIAQENDSSSSNEFPDESFPPIEPLQYPVEENEVKNGNHQE